jgi:hypothetical protein
MMEVNMLAKLLGGETAEKVLIYMTVYEEGYARQISRLFGIAFDPVNKQLKKMEDAGILVGIMKGRTKMFSWNPRYPFLAELKALFKKAYEYLPEEEKEKYYQQRTRPRKSDKKL